MAIIKIYGGVQFPATQIDETPEKFLKLEECEGMEVSLKKLNFQWKFSVELW